MNEDWITTREAVTLSGYHHPNHIMWLVKTGKVKGRKFADVWQISRSSLMAYVQRQRGKKREPKPST
jgi:hypothetical protein